MELSDALGLGPADERTTVPLGIWLPLVVLAALVGAGILWWLDGESGLTSFAVLGGAFGLVLPAAAVLTHRVGRRD